MLCRFIRRSLTGGYRENIDNKKISDILWFSSSGCKVHANRKPSKVAETIEDGVRVVRHEVSKVTDFYDSQKATVDRYYVDAMKETQRKLKFEEIFR